MALSLKDQLLKAGLADNKRARQADHARRQAAKGRSDGESAGEAVQKARAEQAARDREANRAQQEAQAGKALAAQVRQLIEHHRIARPSGKTGGETAWQYTDGRKIRKLLVSEAQQRQLIHGQIAIVRLEAAGEEARHELVPTVVAERIRERLPEAIVLINQRDSTPAADDDDPYKDYPIPDDLMW